MASLSALDDRLADLPGCGSFILFKSDWCPDCVRCMPAVRQVVAAEGGVLVEVDVGPREAWKSPEHALRHDPRFKLSGIPTLVLWRGQAVAAKLDSELENAPTPEAASEVASKFVRESIAVCRQVPIACNAGLCSS